MKIWQCSYCHTSIPDGVKICTGCGARVSYKIERQIIRTILFSILGSVGFLESSLFGLLGIACGFLLAFLIPMSKDPTITPPFDNRN